MVAAIRGVDTADSGTGTAASLTLSLSAAGAQVGDLALAIGEFSSSAVTISCNRANFIGGTQANISTTLSSRMFRRVLDATDIANDTLALTVASATRCAAGLAVISGLDIANSVFDIKAPNPAVQSNATNSTSLALATIDPINPSFIVDFAAINYAAGGTGVDWPAGWTEIFDEAGAQGSQRRPGVSAAYWNTNPTDVAPGAASMTPDQSAHAAIYSWALAPAADIPPSGYNGEKFFPFI